MNTKRIVLACGIMASLSFFSNATELKAANSSVYTNLCMKALSGNRAAMYNEIKASGYSRAFIAKNIKCNGIDILAYVQTYGKNSESMLKILDRASTDTSITDIASNRLRDK